MDTINPIILAVRENPRILYEIVADPENHLNTRPSNYVEWQAFGNIERQAFGKRRFMYASDNRQRTYRNYLSTIERMAMRLETQYLRYSFLKGYQLYEEIARVMSIKTRSRYTWREVKDILEFSSEIIADLELSLN